MQKSAVAAAQKIHFMFDSSQSQSNSFVCVVEDFQHTWPSFLGEIISNVNIQSSGSVNHLNFETSDAVVVKANELESKHMSGRKYVHAILKAWDSTWPNYNFSSGNSSLNCTVNGQNVTLPYSDRVFGIVDLDKDRFGTSRRVIEGRKIQTDPRDTESMLIRLNPERLLSALNISESDWAAIAKCAKRLTGVQQLLRGNELPFKLFNPKNDPDCKEIFSCLKWNSNRTEIEIDSNQLLEKYSRKISYIQREIITQSDFKDEFHLRLRASKLPDDFQGHIITAVIHFAQNTEINIRKFQKKFEKKCKLLSGDFVDSDMGKDIAKWFIDRDISSE